jgi:hypothetical protein
MALTLRSPKGDLPSSVGTLATFASQGFAGPISLVNKTGAAVTCNIYLNTGGTRKRITPQNLSLGAGEQWAPGLIWPAAASDLVEGDASAATSIEYTVGILERS